MLKTLTIRNFRKYEYLKINFSGDEQYIAITGRNGVGKTTILEALNLLLSDNNSKFNSVQDTDFYDDRPIYFEVEFYDYYFLLIESISGQKAVPCKKYRKQIKRRERKEMGNFFSSKFEIKSYPVIDTSFKVSSSNLSRFKEIFSLGKITPVGSISFDEESKIYSFTYASNQNDIDVSLAEFSLHTLEKINFPKVFYFDTERDRELLYQYNTAIRDFVDELDWRSQKEIRKEGNESQLSDLHAMKEGITSILRTHRDTHCRTILKNVQNIANQLGILDTSNLDFHFIDLLRPHSKGLYGIEINEKAIPVTATGSGVSMIIALSFLISFANESKDRLLFLIDEPELHLEPILQKKCFDFLSMPDNVFMTIVSTHSHLFLHKTKPSNNRKVEQDEGSDKPSIIKCNEIELADVQFRLLGNSLNDLYIPESILLVEGKHDKKLIIELLKMFDKRPKIQILDCEGRTQIPDIADRYESVMDQILESAGTYAGFVKKNIRIVIDGDNAPEDRIKGWYIKYGLMQDSIFIAGNSNECMEYLFSEEQVKETVNEVLLKDTTQLSMLSKNEIVEIILKDDKQIKGHKKKQSDNYMSKSRFNHLLVTTLNKDNISEDLIELYCWI